MDISWPAYIDVLISQLGPCAVNHTLKDLFKNVKSPSFIGQLYDCIWLSLILFLDLVLLMKLYKVIKSPFTNDARNYKTCKNNHMNETGGGL